ncbi:MAG: hypothetical protein J7M16_01210 [Anaerolineae bacterium]|nr:hypothetical protein [Anaerolineae bacterium]
MVNGKKVIVTITIDVYEDNEVRVRCSGNMELCLHYMAVMKFMEAYIKKLFGDELGDEK